MTTNCKGGATVEAPGKALLKAFQGELAIRTVEEILYQFVASIVRVLIDIEIGVQGERTSAREQHTEQRAKGTKRSFPCSRFHDSTSRRIIFFAFLAKHPSINIHAPSLSESPATALSRWSDLSGRKGKVK